MAITREQIIDLGFVPSKRGGGLSKSKKYDTLVYRINDTDILYIGYNQFKREINNKVIWKSFKDVDGNRITYPVISLGDTGYSQLKDYISRCEASIVNSAIPENAIEANAPMADIDNIQWEEPATVLEIKDATKIFTSNNGTGNFIITNNLTATNGRSDNK